MSRSPSLITTLSASRKLSVSSWPVRLHTKSGRPVSRVRCSHCLHFSLRVGWAGCPQQGAAARHPRPRHAHRARGAMGGSGGCARVKKWFVFPILPSGFPPPRLHITSRRTSSVYCAQDFWTRSSCCLGGDDCCLSVFFLLRLWRLT